MPGPAWTMILSFLGASLVTGITGTCHLAQSLVEMRSLNLYAWAGSNHNPPDLHLPSS
jgi:hypothetical protein